MNYKKLIGAGMAALGFILFSVLVWPLFDLSADLKDTIKNQQAALGVKREGLNKIADLKNKVGTNRDKINQLTAILPADKKVQEVVVNIEEAARQSGFSLRDFKTAAVASSERDTAYRTLQAGLSGAGSYPAILDFLKLLEKNLRIFDIQDFTISLDISGAATGRLNLDLKLLTYYLGSQLK